MRVITYLIRFIQNAYWKLFVGVLLSIVWFIVACILSISIIFYEQAEDCFKIARFVLKPFSKNIIFVVQNKALSILWIYTFGIIIGTVTFILFLGSIISLGGILLLKQWKKVFELSILPFSHLIINN